MKPILAWWTACRRSSALGIASDTARDAAILHMVREGARWRLNPPSEKQAALARKLGVQIQPGWTSGMMSDAIARITGDWY